MQAATKQLQAIQNQISNNPNNLQLKHQEEENPFDEEIPDDQEYNQQQELVQGVEEQIDDIQEQQSMAQRKTRKKVKKNHDIESDDSSNMDDIFDDKFVLDKLPIEKVKLQDLLSDVKSKIKIYRQKFCNQQETLNLKKSYVGDNSVPICADITKFDFDKLIETQLKIANRQFDVLMMDPPWRLSTSQPSRGVAIQYQSLSDELIEKIPVERLQKSGFLFVWVINAKFQWTVNTMQKKWGYKVVDTINWVKKTVNGKIAKGHGFYLQHAKQTCVVGYKGDFQNFEKNVCCDVIFSDRRGQSQKPTQIYQYIEKLVPNGYYLEIFGRRNNLRQNWVTIGNQL